MYERAGAFLAGRLEDPCQGYALHFGNEADARRGECDFIVVDCGDTGRQRFGYRDCGRVR